MVWENEDDRQKLITEANQEHRDELRMMQEEQAEESNFFEPDPLDEVEDTPCLEAPWWLYE